MCVSAAEQRIIAAERQADADEAEFVLSDAELAQLITQQSVEDAIGTFVNEVCGQDDRNREELWLSAYRRALPHVVAGCHCIEEQIRTIGTSLSIMRSNLQTIKGMVQTDSPSLARAIEQACAWHNDADIEFARLRKTLTGECQ